MWVHILSGCLQEKAKESGVERIVLEARVTNGSDITVSEDGVCKPGIRKNLYEHPVEDGVIMSYTAEESLYSRRVFTWNSRHDAFAKQMAYGTFAKI